MLQIAGWRDFILFPQGKLLSAQNSTENPESFRSPHVSQHHWRKENKWQNTASSSQASV